MREPRSDEWASPEETPGWLASELGWLRESLAPCADLWRRALWREDAAMTRERGLVPLHASSPGTDLRVRMRLREAGYKVERLAQRGDGARYSAEQEWVKPWALVAALLPGWREALARLRACPDLSDAADAAYALGGLEAVLDVVVG